jgi:tRNA(Arg) A34 adenosine deaminase TadA
MPGSAGESLFRARAALTSLDLVRARIRCAPTDAGTEGPDRMNERDESFLRRAIGLAAAAGEAGERPFGSLLVDGDGTVLAEDHNTVGSERDVTAHPELKLARWAARELDPAAAAQTTMYTSCQPCPMCSYAIERSGLGRVVYALSTDQLLALAPAAAQPATVRYDGPALHDEASDPIERYYPR